jgi:hypothetical protein
MCATRHYEWNILDQPLASPMLWCIASMHLKYGCGLVNIGDNNLPQLQGHCEKTNKIKCMKNMQNISYKCHRLLPRPIATWIETDFAIKVYTNIFANKFRLLNK